MLSPSEIQRVDVLVGMLMPTSFLSSAGAATPPHAERMRLASIMTATSVKTNFLDIFFSLMNVSNIVLACLFGKSILTIVQRYVCLTWKYTWENRTASVHYHLAKREVLSSL